MLFFVNKQVTKTQLNPTKYLGSKTSKQGEMSEKKPNELEIQELILIEVSNSNELLVSPGFSNSNESQLLFGLKMS